MCQPIHLPKGHASLESYLSSLGPAEECLPASTSLAGTQSDISNATNTANECCKPELPTGCLTTHQSSGKSGSSMEAVGAVSSMSCQQASRSLVSPSPSPENKPLNWTNEIAGLTPFVSFEKPSPSGVSWKTCPASCLPGMDISEPYSETWPKAGILSGGKCYRQQKWERRISETGCGLWPTPFGLSANQGQGEGEFGKAVRNWPSPQAADANRFGADYARATRPGAGGDDLQTAVAKAMFPTPDANCHKAGERGTGTGGGGQLNPTWVEWLMGWPIGWTDLEPLETDKFQSWLQQHGIS
jgi:hypothetical protein